MELSPKQQSVEQIKKANYILILGPKKISGDFLGSALAMSRSLKDLDKKVEVVASGKTPEIYSFLPFLKDISPSYQTETGKVLRIDTNKFPVKSLKWQKSDIFLDIILEADKNLKFEHVEIINGKPKPDLIIILDCPDLELIDDIYDQSTQLFFEVPIINIDHHSGNDYFGTVNLVDLTATSSAEILVSLFEALGIKIADADIATCLLTGITDETQSFRTQNTTPKSLTVAAQLLAAGARQQEIVSNLYKKRPIALLKLWGDMLSRLSEDKKHRLGWTKISLADFSDGISEEDVFDAADELLSNTPDADIILVLLQTEKGNIIGKLKAVKGKDTLPLAKLFDGEGIASVSRFELAEGDLDQAELKVLKKMHDYWAKENPEETTEEVWNVLDKSEKRSEISEKSKPENKEKPGDEKQKAKSQQLKADVDPIEDALESLEQTQKDEGGLTAISEVIKKKRNYLTDDDKLEANSKQPEANSDIDVFDESES